MSYKEVKKVKNKTVPVTELGSVVVESDSVEDTRMRTRLKR